MQGCLSHVVVSCQPLYVRLMLQRCVSTAWPSLISKSCAGGGRATRVSSPASILRVVEFIYMARATPSGAQGVVVLAALHPVAMASARGLRYWCGPVLALCYVFALLLLPAESINVVPLLSAVVWSLIPDSVSFVCNRIWRSKQAKTTPRLKHPRYEAHQQQNVVLHLAEPCSVNEPDRVDGRPNPRVHV